MKVLNQKVEHMGGTADPLALIEAAGRTCYKSEAKITLGSAEKFVRMILKRGHDSVLEHASVTFRITTDRGISHEIVRHRVGMSYSQESTRYVKYGDIEVIEPEFSDKDEEYQHWLDAMQGAEKTYKSLIDTGLAPQHARSVLPNSLKTEIVVTGNYRAWRHFLTLRMDKAAHPQIRKVSRMLLRWFEENVPVIVEDL